MFTSFAGLYDFALDDFQVRACHEVEEGRGVLVAAPTGSGKTIVGEFAVHLAMETGRKCFYTTPIKALSNQKFQDLVKRYGPENVGLLTGDNTINGEAPIVVMTTEVLRNMLYAGSRTLMGLGYVVMDEVHYLADRMRGAVWEEVIIHLPESVSVISLSATVSNAEEFGEWLAEVRGDTTTIVEEVRPVPLFQHVMVGKRLHDLFDDEEDLAQAGFAQEGAKVNPQLLKVARDDFATSRLRDRRDKKGQRGRGQRPQGRRMYLPSRYDVVSRLDAEGLLPAIVFIFSRVGCDAAVTQCLQANLRLTTPAERDEIYAFVEERCKHLPDDDLHVLGYHEFLDGLTRGVAAHHAGMLPTFKECVEELYLRGLCRVVFATETLALGINMPARTVVLEKLSKWNGEAHVDLTPGEYTQLTGRAGRRGLDVEGHGVVLWEPGMNPKEVAGLASTRTYPLRSSFRPSYNMAVNLVTQFGRDRARELLESSFAQFQADKAVVGLARQLRKSEDALDGYREAAQCHLGDFMEYAALRRRLSDAEKGAARARKFDRRDEVDRVAVTAQAGRRDRRTGRQVRRDGRGHRPGCRRRRPASLRGDRRSAGATAEPHRLPDAGRRDHPDAGAQELQRPQPAAAARPGLRAQGPHPRAHPAPAVEAATARRRQVRRRPERLRDRDRPDPRRAQGAPLSRVPGPRGPRPLGRALVQAGPGRRRRSSAGSSSAPTPSPASSTRSARCSPRWSTSTGTPSPSVAGTCGGSTPTWTWWPPRRSGRGCGRTWTPPSWPRCSRRWSTRPGGPTTHARRGCPVAGPRTRCVTSYTSGPSWTRWSGTTRWTTCGSRTPASRGRRTAGRRATRSTTSWG